MSDDRLPEVVTDENLLEHVQRLENDRRRKESRKARDRRENFELGEVTGNINAVSMVLILSGSYGAIAGEQLDGLARWAVLAAGVVGLLMRTLIRIHFWRKTDTNDHRRKRSSGREQRKEASAKYGEASTQDGGPARGA